MPLITSHDLFLIAFLAFLEGILSLDNALVLAMMAKPLEPDAQKKALTYGLVGSIVFRLIALTLAMRLIHWNWVKLGGGLYLVYVALNHLFKHAPKTNEKSTQPRSFWRTVIMIEVMDIAFAVDSILAAVALSSKFWIVFTGGMIGVILMRFAATGFLTLLRRFPGFERTAYLLILTIGIKLAIDWLQLPGVNFESPQAPAFWTFWSSMALWVVYGFRAKGRH